MQAEVGVRRVDVLLGLGLGAIALVGAQAARELGPHAPWIDYPGWPATIAVLTLTLAPTVARRRFPVVSLLVVTTGLCLRTLFHVPESLATSVSLFLTLQAAGRWVGPRWRNPIRATSLGVLLLVLAVSLFDERQYLTLAVMPERAYYLVTAVGVAFNLSFLAAGWWLGDVDRIRAERERELADRTTELVTEREENARRAVLSERLRIAREIHDVVAHHVSVMGIQAGAARRLVETDPAQAEAPLRAIEGASRDAVNELQRLLLFLRSDELADTVDGISRDDRQPLPGMAQLSVLRRQLADAGLACSYTVVGSERRLPPAVDLSAYRIVQESLTNVLKHARVDRAELLLDYREHALKIEVANRYPGYGPDSGDGDGDGVGTGTGIRGMRERVALVGGHLTASPNGEGRFVVSADLPYDGRAAP